MVGGDNFLTTAGEVVCTYKCKPLLTRVIEDSACYDSLPVSIVDMSNLRDRRSKHTTEVILRASKAQAY